MGLALRRLEQRPQVVPGPTTDLEHPGIPARDPDGQKLLQNLRVDGPVGRVVRGQAVVVDHAVADL